MLLLMKALQSFSQHETVMHRNSLSSRWVADYLPLIENKILITSGTDDISWKLRVHRESVEELYGENRR